MNRVRKSLLESGRAAAFWILAAVAGCASEGGVVGSGISSVSGNVSLVETASGEPIATDPTATQLPFPIRVDVIEVPGLTGVTDDGGNFELTGAFSGPVTLRFEDARRDSELGTFSIEVPAGSTVVLQDIVIRPAAPEPSRIQPQVVQQFDFLGRVAAVDCADDGTGILLVEDEAPQNLRRQQLVRVLAETEVTAGEQRPIGCADVRTGDRVLVVGALLSDRTLAAFRIVVAPALEPDPLQPVRALTLRGLVLGTQCASNVLEVVESRAGETFRRRVRLSPETTVVCADTEERRCACSDIRAGDMIEVQGVIRVARPGVLEAATVVVGRAPRLVRVAATVIGAACASQILLVETTGADRLRIRVEISRDTELVCLAPRPAPCTCASIQRGEGVFVEGLLRIDRPGTIEARRVTIEQNTVRP